MPEADRMLGMYLHLARASHLRRRPMIGDKLLVLAGVQAQEMGLEPISALCRHRVLAHNAHHLVGQWPSLTAALADEQFRSYLRQLKRRYSQEKIEHMLHSLGIEMGREREAYFSDLEYAAALLDTKPEAIDHLLAGTPTQRANGGSRAQPLGGATKQRRSDAPAAIGPRRPLGLPIPWVMILLGLLGFAALAIFAWT